MQSPLTIRNRKDFLAGLVYLVAGIAFAIGATQYKMGSADRMGPSYFPFWLGLLLAFIGEVVVMGAVRRNATPEGLPRFDWRSLAWILLSVVLFGLLLPRLGLVVSLILLVLVSSRASHEFRWKGALLNAAFLLLVCWGAFIYGLNLQLPLWPSFIA